MKEQLDLQTKQILSTRIARAIVTDVTELLTISRGTVSKTVYKNERKISFTKQNSGRNCI